jgi:hypothetical protein
MLFAVIVFSSLAGASGDAKYCADEVLRFRGFGVPGKSPLLLLRKDEVDAFRSSDGDDDRRSMLIELEHLRSGFGEDR